MSETLSNQANDADQESARSRRKFMIVADGSPECRVALRYAALRAGLTGGCVSLLYVICPADFQHWRAVEDRMMEEGRAEAENVLHTLASQMFDLVGLMPELLIREGIYEDEVMDVISSDAGIHVLVIAAGTGKEGPGPLVNMVAGKSGAGFPIPVTVVPGDLSADAIDELSQ